MAATNYYGNAELKKIFEPINIGNLAIKNRIVMAPFQSGGGDAVNGRVTEQIKAFYTERARGGVGLIIMGYLSPIKSEYIKYHKEALSLDRDEVIPSLRELTDAVHAAGAKIGVQLSFYSYWTRNGVLEEVSPSGVIFSRNPEAKAPRPLTTEEIEEIIEDFAEGTRRAKEAGFDLVEYMCTTRAIISEFMSPATNRRTDKYGGSLEKRQRMLLDIIASSRKKVGPDYPLTARISGSDFMEGGQTIEETQIIAPMLEKAGLQALNVTTGWHDAAVPFVQMSVPRGAWVYLGEAVKKVVNIPVIGGTRINDPRLAEKVLKEGRLDMVYMGRALLADPEMPIKAMETRFDDIRPCIACCYCFSIDAEPVKCAVSPRTSRETEYILTKAKTPRQVVVIGGGPAGLEAAILADARGHHVTLFEKENTLGGKLNVATLPPFKDEIAYYTSFLLNQMKKSRVQVKLGTEATLDNILLTKPEVVIVATGGVPIIPNIPGVNLENVVIAEDVLTGKKKTGNRIVIVGGGLIGCETAEFLHKQGKQVMILEMLKYIGNDIEPVNRWVIFRRLRAAKIQLETLAKVVEITDSGISVEREGIKSDFAADTVVLAVGMKAENRLAKELENKLPEVHVIGDASQPRRIVNAANEAFQVALKI